MFKKVNLISSLFIFFVVFNCCSNQYCSSQFLILFVINVFISGFKFCIVILYVTGSEDGVGWVIGAYPHEF